MATPTFDLPTAHRWFAVEFNNRAWDLVESPTRSAAETAEMMEAAHAAAIHWRAIGRPVHQLRSECLLATAYLAAGMGAVGVGHAENCLALCEELGDEPSDFDRAAAHGCAASAHAAAGAPARAKFHHQKMAEIQSALAHAEERELLSKLFPAPQ